tara:strand:- start:156 stop:332 length:177 start_codon:yes stop_codon:yes gene_type:complete
MTFALARQSERTSHLSSQLTPKGITSLSLAAIFMSWSAAATQLNMSTKVQQKWLHHPD